MNLSPKQDSCLYPKINLERPANPHAKNFYSSNTSGKFSHNDAEEKYPFSAQKSSHNYALDFFDHSTNISSNKSELCFEKGEN